MFPFLFDIFCRRRLYGRSGCRYLTGGDVIYTVCLPESRVRTQAELGSVVGINRSDLRLNAALTVCPSRGLKRATRSAYLNNTIHQYITDGTVRT